MIEGSLWRDYNDHIFRVDRVEGPAPDTGTLMFHGVIVHCECELEAHHLDKPYVSYVPATDDPASGEIFGWSRMV